MKSQSAHCLGLTAVMMMNEWVFFGFFLQYSQYSLFGVSVKVDGKRGLVMEVDGSLC